MESVTKFFAIFILLLVNVSVVKADSPLATVEALATKDLLAIAYVDLNSVDAAACLKWAEQHEIVPSDVAAEMSHMTGMVQGFIQQATKAGADHVIALVEQEDLKAKGVPPLLVFSIADGKEAEKAFKSLRRILGLLQIPNFELEVWNNCILAGSDQQIAQAKARSAVERPNLVKAWERFGGHGAGAMVIGSHDTRRVLKELLPKLDSPFENVTGKMIAEDLISVGFSIDLPDDIGARLIVQLTDDRSAKIVLDAVSNLKKMLIDADGEYSVLVPPAGVAAISTVEPVMVGNDVVIDLDPLLGDRVKLMALLDPIQSGSRETQRQNNMRQTVLAMLNYESANKTWPAYANFDADGKPLLSWRVHILPFMLQNKLYKQFNLDEPWNSPHNIKLVEQMPEVYADPSRVLAQLNKSGMTRIVVPFGPETMFHGREGVAFNMITDGSSNTLAVANVTPNQAVVWTQPTDWNVDLENPKNGILDDNNKEAVFARADGSTGMLNLEMSDAQIKALLTKDGGDLP